MIDLAKIRREEIRWQLLVVADISRPQGCYSELMLPVVRSVYTDATEREIRRELDYLEEREMLKIAREPSGRWQVELSRVGIDFVEYTIDAEPGISRPARNGV